MPSQGCMGIAHDCQYIHMHVGVRPGMPYPTLSLQRGKQATAQGPLSHPDHTPLRHVALPGFSRTSSYGSA